MFIFLSGNSSGQNIDLQFLLKIKIGDFEDLIQFKINLEKHIWNYKNLGETNSNFTKSWRNKLYWVLGDIALEIVKHLGKCMLRFSIK